MGALFVSYYSPIAAQKQRFFANWNSIFAHHCRANELFLHPSGRRRGAGRLGQIALFAPENGRIFSALRT